MKKRVVDMEPGTRFMWGGVEVQLEKYDGRKMTIFRWGAMVGIELTHEERNAEYEITGRIGADGKYEEVAGE